MNTHGLIVDFGKHKGQPWTRVPVGYLNWILTEGGMSEQRKEIARAELKRRGTVTPRISISGHAIDRASLKARKIWHENRREDEGLHSWLARISEQAIANGEPDKKGRYHIHGLVLAFSQDGDWPVLATVMIKKQKQQKARPVCYCDPGTKPEDCYCGAYDIDLD